MLMFVVIVAIADEEIYCCSDSFFHDVSFRMDECDIMPAEVQAIADCLKAEKKKKSNVTRMRFASATR